MYNFRLPLFQLLKEHGFEVHIVAPKDDFSAKISTAGFTFHPVVIDNKGSNPVKDFSTLRTFKRIYASINPVLIIHYTIKPNIYGSLAAHQLGIPTVAITTGLGQVFAEKSPRAVIAKQLYKVAFRKPYKVLFLNSDDQDIFLDQGIVADYSKTDVLPGEGIDLNAFKRSEPLPVENRSFLLVGRLLKPKGVVEYVEAARLLKDRYPEVAVTLDELNQWGQEGVINYLGSTDDVASFIQKTTCLVLPSYYREGVPRVLMEAAAMSTPIITTDNVGCREVVNGTENGLLVPVKSAKKLALAMEKIIRMPAEELVGMGENGRKFMRDRFATEKVNGQILSLVQAVLTSS